MTVGVPPPGQPPDPGRAGTLKADLSQRILAGAVLAAIVLALDWAGLAPFCVLMLAVGSIIAWEWATVVRGTGLDLAFTIHAVFVIAGIVLAGAGLAALGLAVVLAGAILVFLLQFGQKPLISAFGVIYTGVPAISLLWLRSDEPWGFAAVLFVFAVVVATDVAAFVAGRTLGGPKLAPSISPNKTWSGLTGGVAAAALAAAAFSLATGASAVPLALAGAALGAIAQAGDLAESALKRRFGVKDASNLIPGHGGFMDRADGIIAAAVAAALFALAVNPHAPAAALMLQH